MKPPPHPYSFAPSHLAAIKQRFTALDAAPGRHPAAADVEAVCASLVAEDNHVASATYDKSERRVSIRLHGGLLGFPVDIHAAPKPEEDGEGG